MRDPVGVVSKVNFICRHVLVLGVVFAVVRLERVYGIHRGELPGAAPLFALRQGQEVLPIRRTDPSMNPAAGEGGVQIRGTGSTPTAGYTEC